MVFLRIPYSSFIPALYSCFVIPSLTVLHTFFQLFDLVPYILGAVGVRGGDDRDLMLFQDPEQFRIHSEGRGVRTASVRTAVLVRVHAAGLKGLCQVFIVVCQREGRPVAEQLDRVRMADAVKQAAFCQGDGILEVTVVDPVYVLADPVFRFMIEGKIIHKMDAAQQEVKALVLGDFRRKTLEGLEIADFQAEFDFYRKLCVPDLPDQLEVILKLVYAGIPVEPGIYIVAVRAHGAEHGNEFLEAVAMLQQPDLVDLLLERAVHEFPDPFHRIRSSLDVDVTVDHMFILPLV